MYEGNSHFKAVKDSIELIFDVLKGSSFSSEFEIEIDPKFFLHIPKVYLPVLVNAVCKMQNVFIFFIFSLVLAYTGVKGLPYYIHLSTRLALIITNNHYFVFVQKVC